MDNQLETTKQATDYNVFEDNDLTLNQSSVFNQPNTVPTPPTQTEVNQTYSMLTPEEKMEYHRIETYKKLGVVVPSQALDMAGKLKQQSEMSQKFEVLEDQSVNIKGGVLGNDKASRALIGHIRNEIYKKYGIEGAN